MNPERFEALLWERVDGTISSQDLAALEAALERNPELGGLEREVTRLASGLDALERLPAPEELRVRIADDVAAPPGHEPRSQAWTSTVRRARSSDRRTRWLPIAASLAIGIALGYLVHSVTTIDVDEMTASGAMAVATSRPDAVLEIALPENHGTVLVTRTGASTTFDLDLAAATEYAVLVKAASGDLNLASFVDPRGAGTALEIEAGEVSVRSRGPGRQLFAVTAGEPDGSLTLEITIDGRMVTRHRIESAREGRAGGE